MTLNSSVITLSKDTLAFRSQKRIHGCVNKNDFCRDCLNEEVLEQHILTNCPTLEGRSIQCIGRWHFHVLKCLDNVSLRSPLRFIKNADWFRKI